MGKLFFLVSKTIGALFTPSYFLIAIGIVGLILILSRYRPLGQKLLAVCVAGFVICGFLPVGNLLILPIETRFPAWTANGGAPDGIVILGGDVSTASSLGLNSFASIRGRELCFLEEMGI